MPNPSSATLAAPSADDPLPIPEGRLLVTSEVLDLAATVRRRAEKFQALIGGYEARLNAKAEEVRKGLQETDLREDAIRPALANAVRKARTDLIRSTTDTRWAALREFDAAARSLKLTEVLFASPAAVLERAGLGTADRSHFQSQVAGAGPVALHNLAAFAKATSNRVLGAALCAAVEQLPRRSRPFSPHELADALAGEEQRAVLAAVETVKVEAQRALNLNREFERGGRNPLARTKIALREQEREARLREGLERALALDTNPEGLVRVAEPGAMPRHKAVPADFADPTGWEGAARTDAAIPAVREKDL